MADFFAKMPDIIIPALGTDSPWYGPADDLFSDALAISLLAPAVLDALTYTIEVTDDFDTPLARTLQGGIPVADVNPPAVTKARVYIDLLNFAAFRIHASGAIGAAPLAWGVVKNWRNF
jgi:hypothetical protein